MNYLSVTVDSECRKTSTSGMTLAQNSSDNIIYFQTPTRYSNVRAHFRFPNGIVSYILHMVFVGYDSDTQLYRYGLQIPYAVTNFTMPSATARLSVSFHCWKEDDFSKGGEAVCDTSIVVNRSSNTDVYDSSYNGTDIENLWRLLGQTSAEIAGGDLLIHVLSALPASTAGYELNSVIAVLVDGDISFYKNVSSAWVKYTFKDMQAEIDANELAVSAEATARQNADAALQGNINANSSAIAQEVMDRSSAVSAEALARENGDSATLASAQSYADSAIAIAEGKTTSYAISNADTTGTANAEFVSTAEILAITGLTKTLYTTAGATVLLSALKLGDVVFVTQSGVPDRWVSAINGSSASFTRIEEKTSLAGYAKLDAQNVFSAKQTFTAGIGNGTYDYALPSASGTLKTNDDIVRNIFSDKYFESAGTGFYLPSASTLTSSDGVLTITNATTTSYSFGYTVSKELAVSVHNLFGKYYYGYWFKLPSHKSDFAQLITRICFYTNSGLSNVQSIVSVSQNQIVENEWIYVSGIFDASALSLSNITKVMLSANVVGLINPYSETWSVQITKPIFVNLTDDLGYLDGTLNAFQINDLLEKKNGSDRFFDNECALADSLEPYNLGYGKMQSRLYGKKIAFCGDSITGGTNPAGGFFYRWPEQIRDRNKMIATIDGISGSTMAETAYHPFVGTAAQRAAGTARYQVLGDSLDYLVIWFGWNDVSYSSIGTIDSTDTTTFYGAYNTVMSYLTNKYPLAKILLVSPYLGSVTTVGNNFQEAVKNIAKKYGCGLYDFRDLNAPVISNKPYVDAGVISIYKANRTYDNTHPNQDGHNIISWEIEESLKCSTITNFIDTGTSTVVTETIANLVANTSAYFDVTGAGTSVSPYLVKPKTTLFQSHAHRLYQIAISTAPVADTYIDFQSSNTERCEVQFTFTIGGEATRYYINFKNIAGYVRSRNRLNAGTLVNTPMNTADSDAIVVVDLNSPEMYTTYAL